MTARAILMATTLLGAASGTARANRGPGPAGSVLIVEESHATPLVTVMVAARTGSAADPRGREGLTNLAAEVARRGAAKKSRADLDIALDAIGATLVVETEPDSVRFHGMVLSKNLDAFLAILADVIQRPDFTADEVARTKREIAASIDEMRNDDRALAERFFRRNAYGHQHPYGKPIDGLPQSLEAAKPAELASHFRSIFVGKNLAFAAAGDLRPDALSEALGKAFGKLKEGPAPRPVDLPRLDPPKGWSVQLVDKPDRQQTQILVGHPTLKPSDPDYLPLQVALASFGGHAMKATMMDEIRTKRGLAYGAYMDVDEARGPSLVRGWVFAGADKTVTTLKLVLKLYLDFAEKGVSDQKLAFTKRYLAGTWASEMDSPARRLGARLDAELWGLPEDWVDRYVERLGTVTTAQAAAAIKKHVTAHDLAITMVATAATMKSMLIMAGVKEAAIDVVKFDDARF